MRLKARSLKLQVQSSVVEIIFVYVCLYVYISWQTYLTRGLNKTRLRGSSPLPSVLMEKLHFVIVLGGRGSYFFRA